MVEANALRERAKQISEQLMSVESNHQRIVDLERRLDAVSHGDHKDHEAIKNLRHRVTALEAKNGSLTAKASRSRRFDETGMEIK